MINPVMTKSINQRKNDAVSPVIGVMLMLVVTIIIASFVSVFAGNIFGDTEATPNAALDVNIISNGGVHNDQYVMLITHNGGDSINSDDLRIVSYYTDPITGVMYSGVLSSSLLEIKTAKMTGITLADGVTGVKIPYLNDLSGGAPGSAGTNFGEYSLSAGDVMSTGDSFGTSVALFGITTTGTAPSDMNGLQKGSVVEVKIIYTPSQKTIYSGKVTVQ